MDIVNWDYLKNKGLLVRNALESPDDLVLVAANTTYKKRGDLFQTYAVPASALAGGGGGGGVTLINTAGLISGGPISTTGTITTSMATNRLVGRYTAGSGVMEQISLGAGLSLSAAGVLSAVTGPVTSVLLKTNNTNNADQTLLDLTSGTGVDVTYSAGGVITFAASSSVRLVVPKTADESYLGAGTWRDVAGLSFNVVSGRTYMFTFNIFFRIIPPPANPNPGSYGTSWSISGTNTFSQLNAFSEWPGTAATTNAISGFQTYDGTLVIGSTASLTTQPIGKATITGTITATSNGTITARGYMEAGATLITTKGSFVEYSSFI